MDCSDTEMCIIPSNFQNLGINAIQGYNFVFVTLGTIQEKSKV